MTRANRWFWTSLSLFDVSVACYGYAVFPVISNNVQFLTEADEYFLALLPFLFISANVCGALTKRMVTGVVLGLCISNMVMSIVLLCLTFFFDVGYPRLTEVF